MTTAETNAFAYSIAANIGLLILCAVIAFCWWRAHRAHHKTLDEYAADLDEWGSETAGLVDTIKAFSLKLQVMQDSRAGYEGLIAAQERHIAELEAQADRTPAKIWTNGAPPK